MNRKIGTTTLNHLLQHERIRKTQLGDKLLYAAVDLVAALADTPYAQAAEAEWEHLKDSDPALSARCVRAELIGYHELEDVLPLAGVMRLIQTLDSPRAKRLQAWEAEIAAQHVEEEDDPELAIQRLRQSYCAKGQQRRWIDQRLRAISARHELVSEWYKRGIRESEEYRTLTNKLMEVAFGMNVNAYRQAKGVGRNLRDHMGDLELSLLSLAETTAANLHRQRQSAGLDQLLRDVEDAGRIIGQTRQQIAEAAKPAPAPAADAVAA